MTGLTKADLESNYRDIIELFRRKEPTLAPDVMEVPISDYTSRERWEREVELFRTTPMLLAFTGELREPGSYWAMSRVGVPLILTRTKAGEVRLFINACRHRGAKVVEEGRGKAPRFTCIYHAWSYGLDGKLLGIAENHLFGDVKKGNLGLTELPVEEREGAIWALLTPGMTLDLDTFLGDELNSLLNKTQFERFYPVNLVELPAANWKLTYEGNCESYHFPSVHAKSFASFTYPNIMHTRPMGPHMRNLTPALGIEECDPTSMTDLQRYVQVSYLLFPSTIVNFASDTAFGKGSSSSAEVTSRLFLNQVLPGDTPETSITISRTMVNKDYVGTPLEEPTRHWAHLSHETVRLEDYPVVQTAQEALNAWPQGHFTMGRNEISIHHFHNSLRQALGEPALSADPWVRDAAALSPEAVDG